MNPEKLLDFHSHSTGSFRIYNYIVTTTPDVHIPDKGLFSAGIHPWYIHENYQQQLDALQLIATNPSLVLIGECGLDRLKGPTLSLQTEIFIQQALLAEQVQKPVILHCVKTFPEIMHLHKTLQPTVPWVIHGFNAKPAIGQELVKQGFFFSFGKALLNPLSNARKMLPAVPISRLFLETDDSPALLTSIYETAAELVNLSVPVLLEQILLNFANFQSKNYHL